jgi:crotonobetainyl-CoA:carnitine CoA-transferase CaiB-like acyl-CoA transferase
MTPALHDAARAAPRPLAGIRVLDLTTVLAGPYCTYQLALLGAEVTKLERPDGGDWARGGTPVPGCAEFSTQFVAQNAGKRSITLDLRTTEGRDAALALMAQADVVVENFAGGVADRLGVGFVQARARRADIVYCAMSGWGQTGPMAPRPAYDHIVQAASGITMLTGSPDTVPNRIGPPLFDYLTGIYGAFAVLAALRERDRTGEAQMVDLAMLDVGLVAMASTMSAVLNAGQDVRASGNTAASGASTSGIFETADGLLSMTGNQDAQVIRLLEAIGLPALLDDPRFRTEAARQAHLPDFRAALQARLRDESADHWETLLAASRVPATRVRTLAEALREPQVRQRAVVQTVQDASTGHTFQVPGIGFLWNGQSIGPAFGPPRLGEHNDVVLGPVSRSASESAREAEGAFDESPARTSLG